MAYNNATNSYFSNVENLCIAGDFATNPWQRGTSFTPSGQTYGPDGFAIFKSSVGVITASQSSVAVTNSILVGNINSPNSLQISVTSADGGNPNTIAYIQYPIEGYDVEKIYNRFVTISFYVRSSLTGTYSLIFARDFTVSPTDYYVAPYTITAADTWQRVSITIPPIGTPGVSWNLNSSSKGADVIFTLGLGSNIATTNQTNIWRTNTTLAYGATGQVNLLFNALQNFYINLLQIEVGSIANPFQVVPESQTLLKCMRYYQKSFPQSTVPAANTGLTGAPLFYTTQGASVANTLSTPIIFPVPMRATPTLVFYNPSAASSNQVRNVTNNTNCTLTTFATNNNEKVFNAQFTTPGGAATTNRYAFHYTADASL